MREIKFRAWDDDAEHMFYSDKQEDDYFFEFKDGELLGFAIRPPRGSDDPMEPPEPYCDDFPVMQFTGSEDKNGKSIYEGDIFGTNQYKGVVESHKETARFRIKRLGEKQILWEFPLHYYVPEPEIIGNIHSNPELLEEK